MNSREVAVVVEDDMDVRNLLETVLTHAGFTVYTAGNGREGVKTVQEQRPQVITLDVGLPDIDGFEALRRIRTFTDAYVLMLTGMTEEVDVLTAFDSGADDYITKPFRPREVRARITTMMRRPRHPGPERNRDAARPVMSAGSDHGTAGLQHNGLTLNPATRSVLLKGTPLELTRSEFDLLHDLMRERGAVRSRAALVRVVRGDAAYGDTYISPADERAVEVHMGNLRRKLGENQESPNWLQTVRGVGYRLAPEKSQGSGLS